MVIGWNRVTRKVSCIAAAKRNRGDSEVSQHHLEDVKEQVTTCFVLVPAKCGTKPSILTASSPAV